MRFKPLVVIVTESVKQLERGITNNQRTAETIEAMAMLGVTPMFLNIREDRLDENCLKSFCGDSADIVWAPALQGGHVGHDIVSRAADKVFGDKVIHYATYTKQNLTPVGNFEIVATPGEHALKNKALECYKSQLGWNGPHFDAVRNKSEYWIV